MEMSRFGELYKRSWELYKKKLSTLATLMAIPFVVSVILTLVTQHAAQPATTTMTGNPFKSVNFAAVGAAALIVIVIFILVSVWIQIATIQIIDSPDNHPSLPQLLSKSAGLVLPLLLVGLLAGLVIVGGLILFIVPGIIFGLWYTFVTYALVLDGQHGRAALKASKALVKGRIGKVFGRLFVFGLVIFGIEIVVGIVVLILPAVARNIVTDGYSDFFVTPLAAIFSYYLYRDLQGKLQTAPAVGVTAPVVAPPGAPVVTPPPTPPTTPPATPPVAPPTA